LNLISRNISAGTRYRVDVGGVYGLATASSSFTMAVDGLSRGWHRAVLTRALSNGDSDGGQGQFDELIFRFDGPLRPTITAQPEDLWVIGGTAASFTVAATGTAPLGFQWQMASAGSSTYADISGATTATYDIASALLAMDGNRFRCAVTNAAGTTLSDTALLTVTATAVAPTITQELSALTAYTREQPVLKFRAVGTSPLTYRWQSAPPGSAVFTDLGVTTATHTCAALRPTDNGRTFRCIVANSAGDVSTAAVVRVRSPNMAINGSRTLSPRLSGSSIAGLEVRVHLDGSPYGSATVDGFQDWSMSLATISLGTHTVRMVEAEGGATTDPSPDQQVIREEAEEEEVGNNGNNGVDAPEVDDDSRCGLGGIAVLVMLLASWLMRQRSHPHRMVRHG
jgi:hypothetical protein